MTDPSARSESPVEPQSTSGEKPSIRKSQEEFIGDEATPSHDRSEYEGSPSGGRTGGLGRNKGMSDQSAAGDSSNTIKDPDTWTTGDEPATGAQLSYLKTLAGETKYEFDETQPITKADASKLIDELRQRSGRVQETK
jgi:hypothetical protein